MSSAAMSLTDTAIRTAKPGPKPYKLYDGRGLYLIVTPNGHKWWRLRYTFADKEKLLSLGVYPAVTLKDARALRDKAHAHIAAGVDPSVQRQAEKAAGRERDANSLEVIAREWHALKSKEWSPLYAKNVLRRLEGNVFPWLGAKPISTLMAPEILAMARRVEKRGALEVAHRVIDYCGQAIRYAITTGRAERDPTRDLTGALPPLKVTHYPAKTDPAEVAELLRTLDGYHGTFVVAAALRLAPLVFVRPGELRQALWADIDLEAGEWRYLVTKTQIQHIVPLATQAVAILRELHPLTGRGPYIFPSVRTRDRPMSNNAILAAFRRLGIPKDEMTGHGFRAMARTILDEVLGFRVDLIEHQLAHKVRDPLGRAYNRTAHLPERRRMMQAWADYLDQLKTDQIKIGANILPFPKAA